MAVAIERHTNRRTLVVFYAAGLRAGSARLVRGSSRRMTTMRSRPAYIRVIRHRAPNLCASDRILAGVCALFMRPARVIRSAIVLRPSTILEFHRALRTRKYRWLFSPKRRRTGPQGPSKALV